MNAPTCAAEIGDFSALRCGLTYVSDFELIPVLVSLLVVKVI